MKRIALLIAVVWMFLLFSPLAAKGEVLPNSTYEKFIEKWEFYFGKAPEITLTFDKNEVFPEVQFRKIWDAYSKYLPLEERDSAEAAFRYHLLNDKRALINSLYSCYYSSRLFPQKNGGILFYLFAEEEIADSSIIQQILPPGENGSKLLESLNLFGESETKIKTRMAVFILKKLVEYKMIRQIPSALPLMLTLTQRLKDSEFVFTRIPVSSEYYIKGEIKGDSKNIKVISFFLDRFGKIEKIGICDASNSPLLIPSQDGTLLLVIFNSSSEEQSDLISATFWRDYNPPVSILSAKLEENLFKISVDESGGILGYKLEASEEKDVKTKEASPFVKSNGIGINDYFFSVDNSGDSEKSFFLKIYTLGGFVYKTPLNIEK